ncbi:MAG: class I SAM-dependent methyltransferase [Ignavibacteriales bacterium]|nr:MAG: class I SAM-dependent methyltransferase [Ignavibacteriales bacterium]
MKCLICGNNVSEEVTSNTYRYYKCSNCNTSQVLPQPSTKQLNDYYNSFHLSDTQGGTYDWVEERMKADFGTKAVLISEQVNNKDIKLLDVGCGKGFFVQECVKAGMHAQGIDVSESGIKYATEVLKVKAECKAIEEVVGKPEYKSAFDVVTLWATIEHVPEPYTLLKSIYSCLKPGGLFILDTGMGNVKEEKYLSGHSQWYDALQHLFVYSEEGLRKILKDTGFRIESVNRNFERNSLRRFVKNVRHIMICFGSFVLLRPLLGSAGFNSMKKESKWPIGKLIQIAAYKN